MENKPGSSGGLAKDPMPVPFKVEFSLSPAPQGKFILHLDAIFRYGRPAAPRYEVDINGHAGSYQEPALELWWPSLRLSPFLEFFGTLVNPVLWSSYAGGRTLILSVGSAKHAFF